VKQSERCSKGIKHKAGSRSRNKELEQGDGAKNLSKELEEARVKSRSQE